MMPVVRISDATLSDLSTIAKWREIKTPSETIEKIVREALDQLGFERDIEDDEHISSAEDAMEFERAPGLTFTRVLHAAVDGQNIQKANWAQVLVQVIAVVKSKGPSGKVLVEELNIPAKAFKIEDEGFRFYDDLGISIQGQSATDAWKEIERLARKWRIPVEVRFQWRDNDKAQHPGKIGLLKSGIT
jgi:hypothetical protein